MFISVYNASPFSTQVELTDILKIIKSRFLIPMSTIKMFTSPYWGWGGSMYLVISIINNLFSTITKVSIHDCNQTRYIRSLFLHLARPPLYRADTSTRSFTSLKSLTLSATETWYMLGLCDVSNHDYQSQPLPTGTLDPPPPQCNRPT